MHTNHQVGIQEIHLTRTYTHTHKHTHTLASNTISLIHEFELQSPNVTYTAQWCVAGRSCNRTRRRRAKAILARAPLADSRRKQRRALIFGLNAFLQVGFGAAARAGKHALAVACARHDVLKKFQVRWSASCVAEFLLHGYVFGRDWDVSEGQGTRDFASSRVALGWHCGCRGGGPGTGAVGTGVVRARVAPQRHNLPSTHTHAPTST